MKPIINKYLRSQPVHCVQVHGLQVHIVHCLTLKLYHSVITSVEKFKSYHRNNGVFTPPPPSTTDDFISLPLLNSFYSKEMQ